MTKVQVLWSFLLICIQFLQKNGRKLICIEKKTTAIPELDQLSNNIKKTWIYFPMQSNLSFLVSQLLLLPLRLREGILWIFKTTQTSKSHPFSVNGSSTFFNVQSHLHQAFEAMRHPFQIINFKCDSKNVSIIRRHWIANIQLLRLAMTNSQFKIFSKVLWPSVSDILWVNIIVKPWLSNSSQSEKDFFPVRSLNVNTQCVNAGVWKGAEDGRKWTQEALIVGCHSGKWCHRHSSSLLSPHPLNHIIVLPSQDSLSLRILQIHSAWNEVLTEIHIEQVIWGSGTHTLLKLNPHSSHETDFGN